MSHHHFRTYAVTAIFIDGGWHVDTINAESDAQALSEADHLHSRRDPQSLRPIKTYTIEQLNIPTDEE